MPVHRRQTAWVPLGLMGGGVLLWYWWRTQTQKTDEQARAAVLQEYARLQTAGSFNPGTLALASAIKVGVGIAGAGALALGKVLLKGGEPVAKKVIESVSAGASIRAAAAATTAGVAALTALTASEAAAVQEFTQALTLAETVPSIPPPSDIEAFAILEAQALAPSLEAPAQIPGISALEATETAAGVSKELYDLASYIQSQAVAKEFTQALTLAETVPSIPPPSDIEAFAYALEAPFQAVAKEITQALGTLAETVPSIPPPSDIEAFAYILETPSALETVQIAEMIPSILPPATPLMPVDPYISAIESAIPLEVYVDSMLGPDPLFATGYLVDSGIVPAPAGTAQTLGIAALQAESGLASQAYQTIKPALPYIGAAMAAYSLVSTILSDKPDSLKAVDSFLSTAGFTAAVFAPPPFDIIIPVATSIFSLFSGSFGFGSGHRSAAEKFAAELREFQDAQSYITALLPTIPTGSSGAFERFWIEQGSKYVGGIGRYALDLYADGCRIGIKNLFYDVAAPEWSRRVEPSQITARVNLGVRESYLQQLDALVQNAARKALQIIHAQVGHDATEVICLPASIPAWAYQMYQLPSHDQYKQIMGAAGVFVGERLPTQTEFDAIVGSAMNAYGDAFGRPNLSYLGLITATAYPPPEPETAPTGYYGVIPVYGELLPTGGVTPEGGLIYEPPPPPPPAPDIEMLAQAAATEVNAYTSSFGYGWLSIAYDKAKVYLLAYSYDTTVGMIKAEFHQWLGMLSMAAP